MHRTSFLAEFVSSTSEVPPAARHACKRVLLDTVGAAIAGAATRAGLSALAGASASWGQGKGRVWFSKRRLGLAGACFVNAAYASTLDIDDGHRAAAGHPGAAIVPAAMTVAETVNASPERLLTAIALGYDVALRVSAARDINATRTTDTGRWCGYGVAAATAWLRGLPADIIAHAMAIAGHTASSQAATGWTKLGHAVKEGIPFAAAAGILAVDLAQAGYTGPLDLLDDPGRYDQARLTADLGRRWEIEAGYFKIYSACRWAHAPIDAALALQAQHAIRVEDVDEIEIGLFARALTLLNEASPQTIDAAQYSIPFSVALAMVHGADALLPVTEQYLRDPLVIALARRIRLVHRPELDPEFPAKTPARIAVRHHGRNDELAIDAPRGEPSNPLSDQALEDKFMALADGRMTFPAATRLKAALRSIDQEEKTHRLFSAMEESVA